jgi:hypothetical protein
MLLTVAELPEYLRVAARLLADADRNALAGLVDVLVQVWLES